MYGERLAERINLNWNRFLNNFYAVLSISQINF